MPTRQSVAGSLADRLRRHVEGDVRFDALTRALYATDASIYQIRPLGVVLPRSLDDVDAAITIAREEGVPVLPRGAGTSQCGQAIGRALVVDTSRHLDRVLAVDHQARTAQVEPGVVLDQLNRQLAPTGLFFPVDVATASRATIGGMAGNNSGGARSIRYGIMADNVTAIEAALADGRIVEFGPGAAADAAANGPADALTDQIRAIADREADELRARVPTVLRHVAGYNLHRLLNPHASMAEVLVGSEGTLAFFRRLTLRLARRPVRRVLGVCGFPSLLEALDAVQHIVELDPHAVELVDDTLTRLARENAAFRSTVEALIPASAHSVLLVEFAGDDDARLSRRLDRLDEVITGPGRELTRAQDPAEQAAIWAVRRAGLNIVMSMKGDRKPVSIVEDCAIPLPELAEFGAAVEDIFTRHGTSSTWYAHASVGCLHVRPSLSMKDPSDIKAFRSIGEEVMHLAVRLGGSHSGEHGDGILRSEFIEPMLGGRLARAFREVKDALDPAGMMNPGKIVGAPRMDDRELFRYGPRYRARALPVASDWSSDGGFVRAVEACNNNGACRKMDPGVMCPSYRVTREETDTTRGRANVLRQALTGQLGPEGLEGDEVADVLELCVGCKACQRECPAGVDMARMKAEVLHLRHRRRGVPLRERLFASLPRLAPVGARFPGLLNLRNRSAALRWLGERTLGIAAANALPEWHRRPFRDAELSFAGLDKLSIDSVNTDSERPSEVPNTARVVLFVDTFSRYFDPNVARAAQSVLDRLGYEPVGPTPATAPTPTPARARGRPLCCGRTYISAGMLDHARAELQRTVAALAPFARRGLPIVGLEPSCLLTLRDEALHLLPDDDRNARGSAGDGAHAVTGEDVRVVAEQALLIDEFLAEHASAASPPRSRTTVQIHGHCHQKAAGTDSATVEALAACAGIRGKLVESSCCGMAGSFGYVASHLRTSRAMGELSLFPTLRASAPEDIVIANGFSCRAQIRAGTGRRARHVVEVLAGHLDAR
ncbi:MAG: FAD-binding and (Fe-S)-binding domain-containing protein [Gemmatimonadetes bacterium]|nr:FAD-binding and (Fe-S)-binding domain-containing protein [Gemmatimonadota bacterium]